ncbi:hypothetical protein PIROE2DRAFT_59355 [Piromyces sp. E2]|nr:hypothetical protein PIROE2DRAFT_59355 [Piromyces sp. E2]|eukprot:OUM66458.1 hypothetical protein PIROE2DRAFT_59355 [Piromyces sp. E2]
MNIKDITFIIGRVILKISADTYYSSIIVENEEFVPENGIPTFICCNHPNSLTVILTSLSRKRSHIKITCKDTLFKMNFLYWAFNTMLDSVPIMRRREYGDKMDNTEAFANLIKALENGDAVLLFPEGPIVLNPIDNKDLIIDKNNVKDNQRQAPFKPAKSLTLAMDKIIRNGILDSPNWEYIEYAQTARNLYYSYGLDITYGNYIRLTRRFLDVFARKERKIEKDQRMNYEKEKDLDVDRYVFDDNGKEDKITKLGPLDYDAIEKSIDIDQLTNDLKEYQDILDKIKISDSKLISNASLGDLEDNFDEIAQKKDLSGLVVILCWYIIFIIASLFTINIVFILAAIFGYPLVMFLGVIMLENYSRSQRNIMYNIRWIKLKYFQQDKYKDYLKIRNDLYDKIQILAKAMNLPSDPEILKSNKNTLYSEDRNMLYKIYIKLLRKEDWNDTLRTRDIIRYSKD